MSLNKEKASAYVREVLEKLSKDPSSLEKRELRFAVKYQQAELQRAAIERDSKALQTQILQGQARVRNLELQHEGMTARMESILDTLVTLHFEDELEPVNLGDAGPGGQKVTPIHPPKAAAKTQKKTKS